MSKENLLERRTIVKMSAAAALLAVGSPVIYSMNAAFADDGEAAPEDNQADVSQQAGDQEATSGQHEVHGQVGFLVKPHNCLNCQACVDACRKANKIPKKAPSRRKVTKYEREGEDPIFVSTSCMHCDEPACAAVCPAGAISKGVAGIVTVDKERCIGCKYCYQACPFGVPNYNEVAMDKCDCCLVKGVKPGETPRCAEACHFGALHYGYVDDLLKKCPEAVVVESSTKPNLYLA